MFLILGFVMATGGLALLFPGDIPLGRGKRLSAVRARTIGTLLVSYLPLAILAQLVRWEGSSPYLPQILAWSLLGVCLCACLGLLLPPLLARAPRSAVRAEKRDRRQPRTSRQPLPEIELEPAPEMPQIVLEPIEEPPQRSRAPAKRSPEKHSRRPASRREAPAEDNPFDFS